MQSGNGFVKSAESEKIQKENARVVIVFHLSKYCVDEYDGNVDITVIGGVLQPECVNHDFGPDRCSHISTSHLYRAIVKMKFPEEYRNGSFERNGIPIAYMSVPESSANQALLSETPKLFSILIVYPTMMARGIYHMPTI